MKIAVVNELGKELRKLDVDDSVFGITPNMAVLHQAYVTQRANQRSGTVKTKSRGEVQGSTAKIRRQKYTGRARAGSNRSPTRVGGGVAFGPRPRSYAKDMPKKMRRLAIRSALSGKVADGELVVIDSLAMDAPKTKEIIRILQNVGFQRSALVVTGQPDRNIQASVRNMGRTKVLPAAYLNVLDMLNHHGVLMTEDAVRIAESLWAVKNGVKLAPKRSAAPKAAAEAPARPKRATKAEPEPEAEAPAPVEAAAEPAAEPRAPKPRAARAPKAEAPAGDEADAEKPKRAPRARATAAEGEVAPKPRRASRAKAEPAADAPAAEGEAPKPKRRTTKKTEDKSDA